MMAEIEIYDAAQAKKVTGSNLKDKAAHLKHILEQISICANGGLNYYYTISNPIAELCADQLRDMGYVVDTNIGLVSWK